MELFKPTVTLYLDERKEKENGKFPLKLTIYCRPQKKRYGTTIDLTREDWVKLNGSRLKDENLKQIKVKIQALVSRAESILADLEPFSFQEFETLFFPSAVGRVDLSLEYWFNNYIRELDSQGREGTRVSYKTTFNSLNSYQAGLKLTDITNSFLGLYETHMRGMGKSPSTIGIYLRQLRAIINQAIDKGVLKQEQYPFKNFQIPASRNIKKALDDDELQLLLNYSTHCVAEQKALDFWVLSYLCNGMNFTDIAHLKKENISGDFMYFFRQKTIHTRKRDLRPIKVHLHPRVLQIIDRWKITEGSNDYIFPILEPGMTARAKKYRIQDFIKVVNAEMDRLRLKLGINQRVGTYVARHSFSTRLMRQGVSPQYIKESLGHSSVAVTENYLGDFSDTVKKEYAVLLTEFL